MLLVNHKILVANTKDPELVPFQKEYEDGIKELLVRFPAGIVQLQRSGYPKTIPQGGNSDLPLMPELPSPVIVPLTVSDANGAHWGYCRGSADVQANGLAYIPKNDNTETLAGEIIAFDLKKKPDYAFFMLKKRNIIGTLFHIYDVEGDRIRTAEEKNFKLRVQYAIRENLSDERLKMIASAWDVENASTKNRILLQEELEEKIFSMEERKKKEATNLSLKGVAEFLAEIKDDDVTRPRAIVQLAIDEGRLTFNRANSYFYFDSEEFCYIPVDRQDTRQEYLANVLRNVEHKDKWITVLKAIVTKDYIETLDKYGVRWLATQVGLPLNKKPEELIKALLAEFVPE